MTHKHVVHSFGGAVRRGVAVVVVSALVRGPISAQSSGRLTDDSRLDSLLARVVSVNPRLRATAARTAASRARIDPAGSRPDPVLMSGVQNFPVFRPGFDDSMTMKMVGISQTLLFPGKQRVRRAVAERDADAVSAEAQTLRATMIASVKMAWYELAYLDQALQLTRQQRTTLDGVAAIALTRYSAGNGSQGDVLTARIDAAKMLDDDAGLRSQRASVVASLNALLARASDTTVAAVTLPPALRRAALPDTVVPRRTSISDARTLQMLALRSAPMLVEHQRAIDASAERSVLARIEARPDFDVAVQYGQRDRLPDMLTVQVAIPLRLQQRTKQGAEIAAARADLAALEAERDAQRDAVDAEIVSTLANAERTRARIALYMISVLPQRQAAVDAAVASYRASTGTLAQVLASHAALLADRITVARALSDFAKDVASLELVVGAEVLP